MSIQTLFKDHFSRPPTLTARAPGRVNLLGEHVDYNDGVVLPVAIDREVSLAAAPTMDGVVSIYAVDLKKSSAFRLGELDQGLDVNGDALPSWARYPAGVAWALQKTGMPVSGMQAAFSSNVPIGAGLSSSAAVEVAFAVAWRALDGWTANCVELAKICQNAENQYVGVNCGLMDQFASACGVAGNLLCFDTRSLDWNPISLPADSVVVIADTGVRRSLTASAYNERRASCEQAVEILQRYLPKIHSLRDVSTVEFAAYSEFLPEVTRKRAEHVVKEISRVDQAVTSLRLGKAEIFGGLMYSGHASLRDLYEVSCPELDIMVNLTRQLPGCYGARLTGAGFGGCTVNLVQTSHAQVFIQRLQDGYKDETGRDAAIYLCRASDGASVTQIT